MITLRIQHIVSAHKYPDHRKKDHESALWTCERWDPGMSGTVFASRNEAAWEFGTRDLLWYQCRLSRTQTMQQLFPVSGSLKLDWQLRAIPQSARSQHALSSFQWCQWLSPLQCVVVLGTNYGQATRNLRQANSHKNSTATSSNTHTTHKHIHANSSNLIISIWLWALSLFISFFFIKAISL